MCGGNVIVVTSFSGFAVDFGFLLYSQLSVENCSQCSLGKPQIILSP